MSKQFAGKIEDGCLKIILKKMWESYEESCNFCIFTLKKIEKTNKQF